MRRLAPLTPLMRKTESRNNYRGIVLAEVTDIALASVAMRRKGASRTRTVMRPFGGMPAPGRLTAKGRFTSFWMSPDCWMVEAPFSTHENLAARLARKLGTAASVTEQNDGWCRLDLQGENIHRVLALLTCVDAAAMRGGEATSTVIHHIGCFILCREAGHVSVLGPRSSAGSLHHAITTAISAAI